MKNLNFMKSNTHLLLLSVLTLQSVGEIPGHKENPVSSVFIDPAVEEFPIINEPLNKNVLHLFTHGRPGELWLEKKWRNPVQIADWLKSTDLLHHKSHLNIYGCEFAKGEKGELAAADLQKMLGIRVAASDDLTGRDGDWNLEWGAQHSTLSFPAYPHNLQCASTEWGNKFHSGLNGVTFRTTSGFVVWGARARSDGASHSATPIFVTPANGFNYTGTPLMAAMSGNLLWYDGITEETSRMLLTTDGIWVWGKEDTHYPHTLVSGGGFQRIGNGRHLPPGVAATDIVKMLGSAFGGIMVLTRSGDVWVLGNNKNRTLDMPGTYGDGTPTIKDASTDGNWHRVKKSAFSFLTGVTQLARSYDGAAFAYAPGDGFYTWGQLTLLGNGSDKETRIYATKMTSPPLTGEPVQIELCPNHNPYLVLDPSGIIHTIGSGSYIARYPGDYNSYLSWVIVKNSDGTGNLENVKKIFLTRESTVNKIGVITCDGTPYVWGFDRRAIRSLGSDNYPLAENKIWLPTVPNNFTPGVDKVISMAIGYHSSFLVKESGEICFAGLNFFGSAGSGYMTTAVPSPTFPFDCNLTPQYANLCLPTLPDITCPKPELAPTKTVNNTTPSEGELITYTINIQNNGTEEASNVSISDMLSGDLTYEPNSISGGNSRSASGLPTLTWTINNLAAGASASVSFQARPKTGTAGKTISNVANVNCAECNGSTNSPPVSITPKSISEISITKTVSDSTPNEGDVITYTIRTQNNGPSTASNVDISDTVPSGLTYQNNSITGGNSRNDNGAPVLTWRINNLAVGSVNTATFKARVNTGTAGNNINNIASVNCTECATPRTSPPVTVTPQGVSQLSITKTVSDSTPNEGDVITYTIRTQNNGPSTASNVDISDTVPSGLTYQNNSITGGNSRNDNGAPALAWRINNLAVGAVNTATFKARVNTGTAGNNINNIASVNCTECATPRTSPPVTVTPQGVSQLSITKTVSDATPKEGDVITYTITVNNAGPSAASNVDISDTVPSGLTYQNNSITGGSSRNDNGAPVLTWRINNLAVGSVNTATFKARVNTGTAGNNINNIASVNCTECATPRTSPPVTVTPQGVSQLSITKTVSDATPNEGDVITYTITVNNAGPSAASNVDISDTVPSGVTYENNSITGGNSRSDAGAPNLTWRINNLAVGVPNAVTFRAKVDTGTAESSISNIASVNCTECAGTSNSPPVVINVVGPVKLSAKLMLQGALAGLGDNAPILMRDDLRSRGLLPATEPYSAMPAFTHVGGGGGETVGNTNVVFADKGNDSIVDWVLIELRGAANMNNVVYTRAGLVQRDGDVVDVDGTSPLSFSSAEPASYYVSVRHRNHLGMMTGNPVALSSTTTVVDFTDPDGSYWDDGSLLYAGTAGVEYPFGRNVWALWGGNANADQNIIFTGETPDPAAVFNRVIDDPDNPNDDPEARIHYYYDVADTTMDGWIIYTSVENETIIIFDNVILLHKSNVANKFYEFIIKEQLP